MQYLEENFISVVLVASNDKIIIENKINNIINILKCNFKNYELIVVDNMSTDGTNHLLREMDSQFLLIELFRKHNNQQALAAGIDIAVGDYIIQIEDCSIEIDYHIFLELYKESQKGNDFVFCTPKKIGIQAKFFYCLLNKYFRQSFQTDLSSSVITLSSRRGENKTASTGSKIVNRNVSYILTGLNYSTVMLELTYLNRRGFISNMNLMLDTLIYYTNVITSLAVFIAVLCMFISVATGVYSIITFFSITTAPGWASMVVMGSAAFSALFFMMAIISKYLYHIIHNTSRAKDYIYKDIIKK